MPTSRWKEAEHLSTIAVGLPHVVLVTLSDHEVTGVIGANVQAGYDALC